MAVITEGLSSATSQQKGGQGIAAPRLAETLEEHRRWVESKGKEGKQAELTRAQLNGADLTGANLRGAILHKANLSRADLFMAELQGACLSQANLAEANLLGAQLQEAQLQGAKLEGATGLSIGQLAGADLSDAALPGSVSEAVALEQAHRLSQKAARILGANLLLCGIASLRIATTTDVQLIKNLPALPLPKVGGILPTVEFYLVAPLFLLGLYLYLHLSLQRLWEGLMELPAVFPSGRRLGDCGHWLVMALARGQMRRLRGSRSSLAFLEEGISILLAYWALPVTLLLFWARYLTREDLRGTLLHVWLIMCCVAVTTLLPALWAASVLVRLQQNGQPGKAFGIAKMKARAAIALGTAFVLCLLSLGTIYGVPVSSGRVGETQSGGIRRWATGALWLVHYDPFAYLAGLEISTRPTSWTGRDDELGQVKGAHLNRLKLRHAKAQGAFFANAQLWEADLDSADLSGADLRGADLRGAVLRSAILDRAGISRANLREADLRRASLEAADLRQANLAFAWLDGATLTDAKLAAAILYTANLRGARLLGADLDRADLREANLEGATLARADLQYADLWSAKLLATDLRRALLGHAILLEASLRNADLRGADLREAVLGSCDFTGANLEGADLRGASGLTSAQICSAAFRREIKLDENLQAQMEGQCGSPK